MIQFNWDMEQGSEQWHLFRRDHKMASECAAVLGIGAFMPHTPAQLYEAKRNGDRIADNRYMRHGREYEALARLHFEAMLDRQFPPCVALGDDLIAASLDGYCAEREEVLEIKVPWNGRKSPLWQLVSEGTVPEHYMAQLQHQMLASGAGLAHFVVYDAEIDSSVVAMVGRDKAWHKRIQKAWDVFWKCYTSGTPPEPLDRDCTVMKSADWKRAARAWLEAHEALKAAQAAEAEAKDVLTQLADGNARGAGVRVTQYERKGAVDYSKVPELQGVDLEPYRKAATTVSRVSKEVE